MQTCQQTDPSSTHSRHKNGKINRLKAKAHLQKHCICASCSSKQEEPERVPVHIHCVVERVHAQARLQACRQGMPSGVERSHVHAVWMLAVVCACMQYPDHTSTKWQVRAVARYQACSRNPAARFLNVLLSQGRSSSKFAHLNDVGCTRGRSRKGARSQCRCTAVKRTFQYVGVAVNLQ